MKATQEEKARIENIAQAVGGNFGYDFVVVEVCDFPEFKFRWTRTLGHISFNISDYICGAPDEVVKDLFSTVFKKIRGEAVTSYSDVTKDYLTSKGFAGKHRRTYLARHGAEPKKFTEFHGIPVHFAKTPSASGKDACASTLMKAIILAPRLKDEDEKDVENIIRYEYNFIQTSLGMFGKEGQTVDCDEGGLTKFYL